jgi:hypothetical protein
MKMKQAYAGPAECKESKYVEVGAMLTAGRISEHGYREHNGAVPID